MKKKFVPALSFGKIDSSKSKEISEFIPGRISIGDVAYDAYHLHLYFQEVLNTKLYFNNSIRADRNEFLKILIEYLEFQNSNLTVCELGSSLMEIVDGFDQIKNTFFSNFSNKVDFFGIEKSKFLADASKILHHSKKILLR